MAVMLFRLEGSDGVYRAYEIDCDQAVFGASNSFKDAYKEFPAPLRKLIDTFLFGVRHGFIQSAFKSHQCAPIEIKDVDKNSETIGHLVQLYFIVLMEKSRDPDTGIVGEINIPKGSMSSVVAGVITRSESNDRYPYELMEPADTQA